MWQIIFIVSAVGAIGAILARICVEVVPEGQVAVVVRLGRVRRVAGPGATFVLPVTEHVILVSLAPERFVTRAVGRTRDGVSVELRAAAVVRVDEPLAALQHARSRDAQVRDAVSSAVTVALANLTIDELTLKPLELADAASLHADDALEAIGLVLVSLRTGAVKLPLEVDAALGAAAGASLARGGAVVRAHTRRLVTEIDSRARADALRQLDRVAARVHASTVEIERIHALRSVLGHDRATVVVGVGGGDQPWRALPPPDAAHRLG